MHYLELEDEINKELWEIVNLKTAVQIADNYIHRRNLFMRDNSLKELNNHPLKEILLYDFKVKFNISVGYDYCECVVSARNHPSLITLIYDKLV